MALLAGTVTVTPDGTVTKTANSLAAGLFDGLWNNYETDTGEKPPVGPASYGVKRTLATMATRLAAAVVTHVTTYAAVTVTMPATPAGDGYQRDPAGAFPDCLGPVAPKTLAGTVT